MKRRHLLGSAAALAILPNAAHAGAFPDHPLRFVVPYAPGGATDTSARIAAERLTELLGQQVIVENRPGGGTIIGTEIVAKAKPDGYTILLAPGTIATNTAFDISCPTIGEGSRRSSASSTCRSCSRPTMRRSRRLPS